MGRETKTGGREATEGVITSRFLSVGKPRTEAPEGFEWTPLTSVARLESGHTPARKHPEYWDGDIPWIGIRDATGNHGRTIFSTRERVTQAGVDNSSTRLLPADTVCLSRTASVGYVVTMGVPMCTSQDFVNWVCGPDLNHRYLSYVLRAEHDAMLRFAHGTTHQTIYFPEVKAFHACLPDRRIQDAVAETIGVLDEKVESGLRIRDTLIQLFLALFRSHTVSFKGQRPLADVATHQKGASYRRDDLQPSTTALVTLKSFGRTGGYRVDGLKPYVGPYKDAQVIRPGEYAVAQTDLTQAAEVVGRVVRVPRSAEHETLVASLDLAIVRPVGGTPPEFVYGVLMDPRFREHCRSRTNGTTVLHLAKDALPDYLVPDVPASAQREFAAAAQPILEADDVVADELQTLAALRDALLPELLSGRLRVPEAEELVSDVV